MTTSESATFDIDTACSLTAAERAQRNGEFERTLARADGVSELPDGYALRFPNDDTWIEQAVKLVIAERKCCPFFSFTFGFEPNGGPVWLHVCGPAEVKALVRNQMIPIHLQDRF